MNPNKVVQLATKAGALLLESGAETYRVEDTIVRICTNFGMDETSSFCTQTGIMLSSIHEGFTYSQVARIKSRSTNLDRICSINQLSRDAQNLSIEAFEEKLSDISKLPTYELKTNIIFASLCAFGFVLLFGGIITEALVAGVLGGFVRFLTIKMEMKDVNSFFTICFSALFITMMALVLEFVHVISNRNVVVIGTIMLLVPGLAITNAIRDSIAGDLVSGTARAVEALLIAIAVALGSGLAMTIWITLGGII